MGPWGQGTAVKTVTAQDCSVFGPGLGVHSPLLSQVLSWGGKSPNPSGDVTLRGRQTASTSPGGAAVTRDELPVPAGRQEVPSQQGGPRATGGLCLARMLPGAQGLKGNGE